MIEKFVVKVFAGGRFSPQIFPFLTALKSLNELIKNSGAFELAEANIEIRYVEQMREEGWSPNDLVDWLLQSHMHVILTHPHQGVPRWDVSEVYAAIQNLKYHHGFPNGLQLTCPIFLQHKFAYLSSVDPITNPTIAVQLPRPDNVKETVDGHKIYTFSDANFDQPELTQFLGCNNYGQGWVIKHPFVTMREEMKFCSTHAQVLQSLAIITRKIGGRIPYTMIQPRMSNR